jgi:prepilin-type N-terminal cleavage/methylation domain-containing protein
MAITRKYNRGFTLIELMVVILIIAILATLATVAGSAAIRSAKQTAIKLELDNMAGQLDQYKADYGSYPPLSTARLKTHLQQKFPRALARDLNTLPDNLRPEEILWVCLRGWTNDPQRPVDFFNPAARRTKTFGFEEGRLRQMRTWSHNQQTMTPRANSWPSEVAVYSYVPKVGKAADQTAPYVYYDCSRNYEPIELIRDFSGEGHGKVFPYFKAQSNGGTITDLSRVNFPKYQIIAAGLDDHFGLINGDETTPPKIGPLPQVGDVKIYPEGINYDLEGADNDNLVNFSGSNLEDAKP